MSEATERKVRKHLQVMLTNEEKLAAGDEMARESQLHAEARERKKEVAAQLTADVESHRTRVEVFGTLIANGYEYREVDCVLTLDLEADRATVVRADTGEIIEDRALRPDERQGILDLEEIDEANFGYRDFDAEEDGAKGDDPDDDEGGTPTVSDKLPDRHEETDGSRE